MYQVLLPGSDIGVIHVGFGELFIGTTKEENVDWPAVHDRIMEAMSAAGLSCKDICDFVGVDCAADDALEQLGKLPRVKTLMSLSAYLGVPASWLLSGKGRSPSGTPALPGMGINETADSTVVQGNSAGTLIINNGAVQMSEQKRELLRIFDSLPIRKQTKLLSFAYDVADE